MSKSSTLLFVCALGILALSPAASAQVPDEAEFFSEAPQGDKDRPALSVTPQSTRRTVISNNSKLPDDEPKRLVGEGGDVTGRTKIKVTSEFQRFVAESTGQMLPLYGADFFANAPTTFAPIGNEPVPAEYTLGPGDELLIRGWGSIEIDFRAKIDRNGLVSIPTIGSIVMSGVKAGEAESVVSAAVARLYKGVNIDVNFGKLRAITIYVVGQASRPGTYTVSSLSTVVTAVFASGGPNANGSMRRLQLKRDGKIVTEVDLYAFIGKGDKSADTKLRDGDTIYIPQASGHIALTGKVNTPAIFELRTPQDTLESMLAFSGGMPVVADPRRAFLERIDQTKNQPRSVEQFVLNAEGLRRPLKNGDLVNITSITPEFSNAVVLRGNVDQPVRAPYVSGMRISDLIPNRDYLLTRRSLARRNNAVRSGTDGAEGRNEELAAQIGGTYDDINWDYAVVERIDRSNLNVSLIPFNLGKVFSEPAGKENIQLVPGDTITIFSQKDVAVPLEKRRIFVRIEGEVNAPGVYQMNAGETLHTLMSRAGGTTPNAYLFGAAFYREQVRKEQEANLAKVANKLESQYRSWQSKAMANTRISGAGDAQLAGMEREAELQNAREAIARIRQLKPSGRIAFGLQPQEKSFAKLPQLRLENGDQLVIPARPEFIHVFGAVNSESSPMWKRNARVGDYLKIVGVTADADVDNVVVMRADGSVLSRDSGGFFFGRISAAEVMPGDSIIVPEKFDKETAWTKFTQGTREWAQIFANFGLGAAAIKVLK